MSDLNMTSTPFIRDCLVVELGSRVAVGACGSILAQLGATVIVVEGLESIVSFDTKFTYRESFLAGKKSFKFNEDSKEDHLYLMNLIRAADVLIYSSDIEPHFYDLCCSLESVYPVKCDITAFGSSGPLANKPYSDQAIQALSGVLDSTGALDDIPILIKYPLIEFSSGIYAASAILAAKRLYQNSKIPQRVEIAMYDIAFLSTASFLPAYLSGGNPKRIGNQHPSMAPWNLYPTNDGWILLCAGSNDEWSRVCREFNSPELILNKLFATPSDRVKNIKLIDEIVGGWISSISSAKALKKFSNAKVSCGPVYSLKDLFNDESLATYDFFENLKDPISGLMALVPGTLFHGSVSKGLPAKVIPKIDQDRVFVSELVPQNVKKSDNTQISSLKPMADIFVLEMGNYTTAPLIGRQLGALGAYVVKVEPPKGDLCRPLPPHKDGQGYFFTLGNSDKSTIVIDLATESGKSTFSDLIKKADIFIENLKSGSLGKFGFDDQMLSGLNPRLVHCSITGFGARSKLANIAAMDTTIQGMAGMMFLTSSDNGIPYKSGVSAADLTGGQLGLVSVLGALEYRDKFGVGQHMDLSMQMSGAWLTQTAWNYVTHSAKYEIVQCSNGFLLCGHSNRTKAQSLLDESDKYPTYLFSQLLLKMNIESVEICSIRRAAESEQTLARKLISHGKNMKGVEWPLLACPMKFSSINIEVERAIGDIGSDGEKVLRDWGIVL